MHQGGLTPEEYNILRPHRLWLDGIEGAMLSCHGERFAMERNDKTAVGIAHENGSENKPAFERPGFF